MSNPQPYGKSTINNSPLDASGSDFPCKQRSGVYDDEGARAKNTFAVGATVPLAFTGSAVHGGGSCQISLTKDEKPTKNSQWAVIKSMEGGCPGTDGGASTSFNFAVPNTVAAGDWTMAWTWFNKIGNREIYMNCAPITITGGSKKREVNETTYEIDDSALAKRDASFPAMFLANMGNGCKTDDSKDLQFPDPGTVLEKASTASLSPPTGTCPKLPNVLLGGAASGSSGSASPNTSTPASNSTGTSAPTAPGTATILASQAPSPSSASSNSAAAGTPSASSSAASPSAAAGSAATPSPASGGSSGSSGSGSASASGAPAAAGSSAPSGSSSSGASGSGLTCSADGKQFQVGPGAPMQPVAAGTKCENGQITFAKRSAKFARNVGGWY